MSSEIVNKKAGFNYFLQDRLEAGIALTGGEVKSVRSGSGSLDEAYVRIIDGQAILVNCYIAPYKFALDPSYDPKRERKLLLNKQEIEHLAGKVGSKHLTNSDLRTRSGGLTFSKNAKPSGLTIVPTKVYNSHNLIKVEVAIGTPKKKFDKREDLKKKAIQRETEGFLRAEKAKNKN